MNGELRPMRDSDLGLVLSWRNAEDVRTNMYTHHLISSEEHRHWWATQSVNPTTRLLICDIDGQPAGVVTFTNYTGKGGSATWAFYSGDRTRRGVGRIMERAALEYAFGTLNLHRLNCEVLEFNRAVVEFHLKHGFSIEGVFRKAYARDGKYYDIYRLAMLADEWQRFVKPALEAGDAGTPSLTGRTFEYELAVSPELVDAYAEATGDRNPVHIDDGAARQQGFAGRIAHGMLIGGTFSRHFAVDFPGPGTIYVSQSLRFLAPVQVGAHGKVRLRVLSHVGRRLLVETHLTVDGKVCVEGEAELVLPKGYRAPGSSP